MKLLFKKLNALFVISLLIIPFLTQATTIDSNVVSNQTNAFRLGSGFQDSAGDQGLSNIVAGGIQIMLSVLGILFIILIIISGFRWMTAGGNEEQITKARKNITSAVLGLFIVLAAYAVTWFIFNYLPLTAGSPGGEM